MAQLQNQPQTPPQDQRQAHRVLIKVNIVTIGREMENVKRIRLIWTKVVARVVISAMAVAAVGKIVTISLQIVLIGQELVNVQEIQLIWDPIALKAVVSADKSIKINATVESECYCIWSFINWKFHIDKNLFFAFSFLLFLFNIDLIIYFWSLNNRLSAFILW